MKDTNDPGQAAETHEEYLRRWRASMAAFDQWGAAREVYGYPRAAVEEMADRARPLDFSGALLALKAGHHVARGDWPDGVYVTMQVAYPDGIGLNANTAAATGLPEGTVAVFPPYLMRCFPPTLLIDFDRPAGSRVRDERLSLSSWTPGQLDLFAVDWQVLDRSAGA